MPNFKEKPVKFGFKIADTKVSNDLVNDNLYHISITYQFGDKFKQQYTTVNARTRNELNKCIKHLKSKVLRRGKL